MDQQPKSSGPAPGFIDSPDHRVDVEPSPKRVRMKLGGETIADSTNALLMLETNHRPIYYFPRTDIRMNLMVRTDRTSF